MSESGRKKDIMIWITRSFVTASLLVLASAEAHDTNSVGDEKSVPGTDTDPGATVTSPGFVSPWIYEAARATPGTHTATDPAATSSIVDHLFRDLSSSAAFVVTATSQVDVERNLASKTVVRLGADIVLSSTVQILNGQSGLVIDGTNKYKVDGAGSVRCFIVKGPTTEVVVQNLTISRGYGISTLSGNTTVLDTSRISTGASNSTADAVGGGAFFISEGARVVLTRCVISGSSAQLSGGGLYITAHAVVMMSSCMIYENTAPDVGGGIFVSDSTLSLEASTISRNSASAYSDSSGGGLYVSGGNITLSACSILANTAADGGGFFITEGAAVNLESGSISNNVGDGGGFYISSATVALEGCTVADNTAPEVGGGFYIYDSSVTLTASEITRNAVTATFGGGGIRLNAATLLLIGCAFSQNTAPTGPDVFASSSTVVVHSACPASTFNTGGSSALDCEGCTDYAYPKNLLGGICLSCPAAAPFSCCGSLSSDDCSSEIQVLTSCAASEISACPEAIQTPSPSTTDVESPTALPTSEPTTEPTNPTLLLDEDVIYATEAATSVLVGVSTVASVGASAFGSASSSAALSSSASASSASSASGGAASSGSSTSSTSSAVSDPLCLLFVVQSVAVSSKLSFMPESYVNFASSFSMFNLQFPLPSVATSTKGSSRRLKNENLTSSGRNLLRGDGTEATELLRRQMFWAGLVFAVVVSIHGLVVCAVGAAGRVLPPAFHFPHVEIKMLLAMSMGAVDCSCGVLAAPATATFWKYVAGFEIMLSLCFVWWFVRRSKEFEKLATWAPLCIVPRHWTLDWGDRSTDTGFLSKAEVEVMAKEAGHKKGEFLTLFAELDKDGNGVLDYEEFIAGFEAFELTPKVPFQRSTCLERSKVLLSRPGSSVGRWLLPKEGDESVQLQGARKWARHFELFTPAHVRYYPVNLLRQLLVAAALSALAPHAVAQAAALCLIEGASMASVLRAAPFALLGDSRSDMSNYTLRFAANLLALGVAASFAGVVPAAAASVMIACQVLAILQTALTQLTPLVCAARAAALLPFIEDDAQMEAENGLLIRRRITLSTGQAVRLTVNLASVKVDLPADLLKDFSGDAVAKKVLAVQRAAREVLYGQAEQLVEAVAEGSVRAYAAAAVERLSGASELGSNAAGSTAGGSAWAAAAAVGGLEAVAGAGDACFKAHLEGLRALRDAVAAPAGPTGSAGAAGSSLDGGAAAAAAAAGLGAVKSAVGGRGRAVASLEAVSAALAASPALAVPPTANMREARSKAVSRAVERAVLARGADLWDLPSASGLVLRAVNEAVARGHLTAAVARPLLNACVDAAAQLACGQPDKKGREPPPPQTPLKGKAAATAPGELESFLRDAKLTKHAGRLARLGVATMENLEGRDDGELMQSAGMSRIEVRVLRKRMASHAHGCSAAGIVQLEMQRVPTAQRRAGGSSGNGRQAGHAGMTSLDDEYEDTFGGEDAPAPISFAGVRGIRAGAGGMGVQWPERSNTFTSL